MVEVSEIRDVCARALEKAGAAPWVAEHMADATARAEQIGNTICGLSYMESYCGALGTGRVDGLAEPVVEALRPGSIRVDARQGFAQPAFARGLPAVVEAARANGIAALGIANSHTCTSLGYFTEQIAAQGMLALGFTNASPVVAPPGGSIPVIGTNPVAFSVPDGAGGVALHFDAATSNVALGAIKDAKAANQAIPEGWAVGPDGAPTTDPAEALKGALTSLGGPKGFGLGLMAEVLAAGMTGSVNSVDVAGLKLADGAPHNLGQFYIVLDPGTSPEFFARLERLTGGITDQPGTRVPGTTRGRAEAVSVNEKDWGRVRALAGF